MPTLLHLQGYHVPRSLHGDVRIEVWDEDETVGEIVRREPIDASRARRDAPVDEEKQKERLRDLGDLE